MILYVCFLLLIQAVTIALLCKKTHDLRESLNTITANLSKAAAGTQTIKQECNKLSERVFDLERGIMPDYEQAKAAKANLDKFNATVNTIYAYDMEEYIKSRNEGGES